MKGKQTLSHRFRLGGSIVSYRLINFGLLPKERNKQIKSLWAVKKKKVTILPNNGRYLQIALSLGKSPVHKGYYSSAPKPWLISGRNSSSPRLLRVSKEQRNNTLLRRKITRGTTRVSPGKKAPPVWLVSLEEELTMLRLAPFRVPFLESACLLVFSALPPRVSLPGLLCHCAGSLYLGKSICIIKR